MTRHKRRRKLIEPRLQLKFALTFFTTAGLPVLGLTLMFGYMFDRAARSLPNDGPLLLSQVPLILRDGFLLTGVVLIPIALVVGIHSTFRILGPIYRFRVFLTAVIAGKQRAPCQIRRSDELHDICDLINRATEPVRTETLEPSSESAHALEGPAEALPSRSDRADPIAESAR